MKSIRKKLSIPFICILIIIPMVTILFFNIGMKLYAERTAKKSLTNTIAGIELLVKQQLRNSYLEGRLSGAADIARDNLANLRTAFRLSQASTNIEFLLLNEKNEILFPKTFEDSFLNQRLLDKVIQVTSQTKENELVEVRIGRTKYYAVYRSITGRLYQAKLLFISTDRLANTIIRAINLLLLGIMLLTVAVGILAALGISGSISKPITRLSAHAKRIGNGEFITLPEDRSSLETYELTSSMNEMSNRLREYDTAQKTFLQNASHELRTPLMSIQGYAEGIAKGVFTDTAKTAGIICEESSRLNTLVEELLTLSRIENKTYQGEFTIINLSDNIKDYLQRIEGYALKEGKSIRLMTGAPAILVKINEDLLLQAVINVVSNCIKYARTEVTLTVYPQNNNAVIRIEDDGNGISKEDLPHIFERFYKGKKGSFGLGLSIAKSAVEYMGGTIHAFNGSNGAVFELKIPGAS